MNNRGIAGRLHYPPAKSEPVVFFLPPPLLPLHSSSSTTTSIEAPMDDGKIAPFSTFPTTCAALLSSAFCHLPLSTSPRPPRPVFTSPICSIVTTLHASLLAASERLVEVLGKSPFSLLLRPRCFLAQNQLLEFKRPNSLSMHNFAAILPGDSVAGIVVASGISNFLNLYNTLLVIRLVLTWFPNSPPAIVSPLSTICDPYLNIFRGLIPPLGGTLDLSPILAFLVLNAFTSTAAALPAELPTSGSSPTFLSSTGSDIRNLTCMQTKWMRRISRSRPAKPEE